jgi:hypothetical protein
MVIAGSKKIEMERGGFGLNPGSPIQAVEDKFRRNDLLEISNAQSILNMLISEIKRHVCLKVYCGPKNTALKYKNK